MKESKTKPNLFVVDTPHQLLNAIEATNSLGLTNNHLLVVVTRSANRSRFMSLIKITHWASVSFRSPFIDPMPWVEKLLGTVLSRWYYRYLHFRRMWMLAQLTSRFRIVDKLFLGHDFEKEKPYMRHIANSIEYNEVCLLDDGTDTIEINKRRHEIGSEVRDAPIETVSRHASVFKTLEMRVRTRFWKCHVNEIPCVTFFTIYNVDPRKGDRLIRNNYSYLRSLAPHQLIQMPDTVIFLGECIAEDYVEARVHFEFLSKSKDYFSGKKIIYVPHPRESAYWVNRIREALQWEIWPSSSVIEQDIIVRGVKPKAVAGFVSSALITLANLMDADVEVVCFHIAPEQWIGWREEAVGVYRYLREEAQNRVTIVPLTAQESQCEAKSRAG